MTSSYETAQKHGYTDEQIKDYFSQKDPEFAAKYDKAIQNGYQPGEIFQFYSESKKPKETIPENINRQLLRSGARAAETVIGAPRAIGEALESIVPEKLITAGAEKIGLKEPVQKGFEIAKKFASYKLFPTSEQAKDFTKTIFGSHLEPKNEWEKFADETISDFTALAIPLPGNQFKVLKPALLSLGGNLSSELIGQMSGTEKEKTLAKLGTIFLGSMVNPKAAETLKNGLYENARASRPPNVRVITPNLDRGLNQVERQLKQGGSEPWKDKIFTKIKEVRNSLAGNAIEVSELEKFKTSLNNIISDLYKEGTVAKPGIKSAQRYTKKLGKVIDNSLKDYGRQNPQWEAFYRPANEVHGAIAESQKVRSFLGRIGKKYGHHFVLPLLGIGHTFGPAATAGGAIAGGALGAGALLGGEILTKAVKSPTIRKLYANLFKTALKENTVATRENLNKLEKELKKKENQ